MKILWYSVFGDILSFPGPVVCAWSYSQYDDEGCENRSNIDYYRFLSLESAMYLAVSVNIAKGLVLTTLSYIPQGNSVSQCWCLVLVTL